jgi:hypothetical protein
VSCCKVAALSEPRHRRVGELAALGSIELHEGEKQPSQEAADMAGLIWDARRLTADQVQQVIDKTGVM